MDQPVAAVDGYPLLAEVAPSHKIEQVAALKYHLKIQCLLPHDKPSPPVFSAFLPVMNHARVKLCTFGSVISLRTSPSIACTPVSVQPAFVNNCML